MSLSDALEQMQKQSYPADIDRRYTDEFEKKDAKRPTKNAYICDNCRHATVTVDVDVGVTPFTIQCPRCGSRSQSLCYKVVLPSLEPEAEWYRPKAEELVNKSPGVVEHVVKGGLLLRPVQNTDGPPGTFQEQCADWVYECFPPEVVESQGERAFRFFEEAAELAQAMGMNREEMEACTEYVLSRPKGDLAQEVGGVAVTLDVLCAVMGIDREREGWRELERIDNAEVREGIRQKQLTKPHPED